MAITITNLITVTGSNTDATAYAAASLGTVAAGTFLVACVANGVATQPAEDLSSVTGTLGATLTWTNQVSALISVSSVVRTSIWTAPVPSGGTGNLTFNFPDTQSNCQWQILGVTCGAGNVISVTNTETYANAAANPSLTISPSPPAGSAVIGAMTANSSTAATAGSGWTLNSGGSARTSPAAIMAVQYDTSNPSATFNFTQASSFNRSMVTITMEEVAAPSGLPYNVVVGGAKKTAVSDKVIVGGAKKTVVNRWVIVGGAKKTIV